MSNDTEQPETESGAAGIGANVSVAESFPIKHPVAYCDGAFVEFL